MHWIKTFPIQTAECTKVSQRVSQSEPESQSESERARVSQGGQ